MSQPVTATPQQPAVGLTITPLVFAATASEGGPLPEPEGLSGEVSAEALMPQPATEYVPWKEIDTYAVAFARKHIIFENYHQHMIWPPHSMMKSLAFWARTDTPEQHEIRVQRFIRDYNIQLDRMRVRAHDFDHWMRDRGEDYRPKNDHDKVWRGFSFLSFLDPDGLPQNAAASIARISRDGFETSLGSTMTIDKKGSYKIAFHRRDENLAESSKIFATMLVNEAKLRGWKSIDLKTSNFYLAAAVVQEARKNGLPVIERGMFNRVKKYHALSDAPPFEPLLPSNHPIRDSAPGNGPVLPTASSPGAPSANGGSPASPSAPQVAPASSPQVPAPQVRANMPAEVAAAGGWKEYFKAQEAAGYDMDKNSPTFNTLKAVAPAVVAATAAAVAASAAPHDPSDIDPPGPSVLPQAPVATSAFALPQADMLPSGPNDPTIPAAPAPQDDDDMIPNPISAELGVQEYGARAITVYRDFDENSAFDHFRMDDPDPTRHYDAALQSPQRLLVTCFHGGHVPEINGAGERWKTAPSYADTEKMIDTATGPMNFKDVVRMAMVENFQDRLSFQGLSRAYDAVRDALWNEPNMTLQTFLPHLHPDPQVQHRPSLVKALDEGTEDKFFPKATLADLQAQKAQAQNASPQPN